MEQQRAERRRVAQRRREAAERAAAGGGGGGAGGGGAPAEMDLATLLATFPPDVREEVLLTSEDSVLQTLPPALLAEANALRERYRNAVRRQQVRGRSPRFSVGPMHAPVTR